MHFTTSVAALAALAGPAAAFWRMPCPSRLIDERIDPLIFPGQVSAHTHTVVGGNGKSSSTRLDRLERHITDKC